jgi:hypothetical protein
MSNDSVFEVECRASWIPSRCKNPDVKACGAGRAHDPRTRRHPRLRKKRTKRINTAVSGHAGGVRRPVRESTEFTEAVIKKARAAGEAVITSKLFEKAKAGDLGAFASTSRPGADEGRARNRPASTSTSMAWPPRPPPRRPRKARLASDASRREEGRKVREIAVRRDLDA